MQCNKGMMQCNKGLPASAQRLQSSQSQQGAKDTHLLSSAVAVHQHKATGVHPTCTCPAPQQHPTQRPINAERLLHHDQLGHEGHRVIAGRGADREGQGRAGGGGGECVVAWSPRGRLLHVGTLCRWEHGQRAPAGYNLCFPWECCCRASALQCS